MGKLETIRHKEFDKIKNIDYGFFTRHGGVSVGNFESLNIKYTEDVNSEHIKQNRKIIAKHFEIENSHLLKPFQTNETKVFVVKNQEDVLIFSDFTDLDKIADADGMVTNLKGVVIGISTADCTPVLLVDESAEVIGVAHAGWKGAKFGVLENTINEMMKLGANKENIKALLGPCIQQDSYEVDKGFFEKFLEESEENQRFFKTVAEVSNPPQMKYTGALPDPNKYFFDLPGYVKDRLGKIGIKHVYDVEMDTYTDDKFFSYRRNCHQGKKTYGAHYSGIGIRN